MFHHTLSTWELVVKDTMDGEGNPEENTREVADNGMYHISWDFLQLERDMVCRWWLTWKLFIASIYLTTLSKCELVANVTVDGMDNKEGKSREVANIRMYHFGWNFFQLGCDMLWWWWSESIFLYFQPVLCSVLCIDDRRHCGKQGQSNVGDNGGWWHHRSSTPPNWRPSHSSRPW